MKDEMQTHIAYMQRALELAQKAEGQTSPNPLVGAVIVKNGRIIGEGYHHKAGMPHAEVEALRSAEEDVTGATMYVTLEPCSHHGRTGPCSQAIVDAGITEVFYAVEDPNPRVSGRGRRQMQSAGVIVHNSVGNAEAIRVNRAFFKYIQTGLPYVTAKFAMTLDGKIATATGDSQWITNGTSRQQGHRLRQVSDAILVGVGTVLADNPRLTTRLSDVDTLSHPVRIVVDSHGRTPLDANIVDPALPGQTVIATTAQSADGWRMALKHKGVQVWILDTDSVGRVDITALLHEVARHEWMTLMVEGGGTLLGSLLARNHIDRVWAFIAPKIVGGQNAPTPFGGDGIALLRDAMELENIDVDLLDGDIWVQADVKKKNCQLSEEVAGG